MFSDRASLPWRETQKQLDAIRDAIADKLGLAKGSFRDWQMPATVGIDSLDFINLHFELEKEFNINLPDGDWRNCQTFGDAIHFVYRVRSEQEATHHVVQETNC